MRRPNENARMAERSQMTMCLHMAESEHVDGEQRPAQKQQREHELQVVGHEDEREHHHGRTRQEEPHGHGLVHLVGSSSASNSRNRHVAATSASTDHVHPRMHGLRWTADTPSANPAAMPDVAVARYERQTTRCRPSDTFRIARAGGPQVGRSDRLQGVRRRAPPSGNSSAKKKLISAACEQQPRAGRGLAQAKMPCDVGLDGPVEEQAHVFAVQRVQEPEAASRKQATGAHRNASCSRRIHRPTQPVNVHATASDVVHQAIGRSSSEKAQVTKSATHAPTTKRKCALARGGAPPARRTE